MPGSCPMQPPLMMMLMTVIMRREAHDCYLSHGCPGPNAEMMPEYLRSAGWWHFSHDDYPCFLTWRQTRCCHRGQKSDTSWAAAGGLGAAQAVGSPEGQPLWHLSVQVGCSESRITMPTGTLFSLCSWNALSSFSSFLPFGVVGAEAVAFSGSFSDIVRLTLMARWAASWCPLPA